MRRLREFFQQSYVKRTLSDRNDCLIALCTIPLYVSAIGKYGIKIIFALLLLLIIGAGVEIVAYRLRQQDIDVLGYPVWILLPLALPPVFPLRMICVALFFGLVIGVAFFGGHGRVLASPVAIGWAFAALSFPFAFNLGWSLPFPGFLNGFKHYLAAVITTEHPLVFLRDRMPDSIASILRGNFPQPTGNAIPYIVIVMGLFLLLLRAIDYRMCLSFLGTVLLLSFVFHNLFPHHLQAPFTLLVGNFLFVGFFIFPDHRIAPRTPEGRWLIGMLTGIVAFVIRNFSSFPDGVLFAVLFGNVFSAIIDEGVLKQKLKEVTE